MQGGAYAGQLNAHHLASLELTSAGPGRSAGSDTHTFETEGPAMSGAALLRHDFELLDTAGQLLPQLGHTCESRSRRGERRRWCRLWAENAPRRACTTGSRCWRTTPVQPTGVRELIDDDLMMRLSDGKTLRGWPDIRNWHTAQHEQVAVSCHQPVSVEVTESDGRYDLAAGFRWRGISPAGQPMIAQTRHAWQLADRGERYARIADFSVRIEQPFTAVTVGEALEHHRAAFSWPSA